MKKFLVLQHTSRMKLTNPNFNLIVAICMLSFGVASSRAQGEKLDIDSLANIFINYENVDLKTFDLLFHEVHLMYPDELAHFAEILLKRSIQQDVQEGVYRAHDAFAFYFLSKGYFNHAFKLLLKAKKFYESEDHLLYRMKNYYYIARVYVAMGNLNDAINWMQKSMDLAEKNPDRNSLYTLRNDITHVYFRVSNYEKGKEQLDLNETEWGHLSSLHRVDLRTLQGNYLMNLKKSKEAKTKYDEALSIAIKTDDPVLIATCYTNLGIYEFEYDVAQSKAFFETSLYYAQMSNFPDKIALDYYNLASWHYAVDDLDSALHYFSTSYKVVEQVNSYAPMLDAIYEMVDIHRTKENWPEVDRLQTKIQAIKTEQYTQLMQSYDDLNIFESQNPIDAPELSSFSKNRSFLGIDTTTSSFRIILFLIFVVFIQTITILVLYKR